MNNYHTYDKLQFDCGTVMMQKTHALVEGQGSFHIARSVAYDYPRDELAAVHAELSGLGIDVVSLFTEIQNYEKSLGGLQDYTKLPATIVDRLTALYNAPSMELLRIMHDCFDDWTITIFRSVKLLAAVLFGEPVCRFVVDSGASGSNGKTVQMRIMEVLLGGYADQAKEAMLTKPPPAPGAPAPDLLALRGVRALATPEFETTQKLRSAWLKAFADSATKWKARDLYASQEITFKLICVFFVSINERLQFSVVDGGVFRRALCIPYFFTFVEEPSLPHHRKALPEADLKSDEWIQARISPLLYLMIAAHDVFFNKGNGLGKVPHLIVQATEDLMTDEAGREFRDWLSKEYSIKPNPDGAIPRATFMEQAREAAVLANVLPAHRDKVILAVVTFVNTKAGRDKTRLKDNTGYVHNK